ncbi:hypothetical protein [Paraburkholderia hospita]|uniref:hypothetical protein n=1 Tax=Paraburkholderia hospita TaxID=169430 RepID=UPI00103B706D|nr:hypothetical protein [Paraburkholderia hospita]
MAAGETFDASHVATQERQHPRQFPSMPCKGKRHHYVVGASHRVVTVNVLPFESDHDYCSANCALTALAQELDDVGIDNVITASHSDLMGSAGRISG